MSDLFVYGTLMRGASQGALLAHLPRETARVSGRLYRMPAGYPALVAERGAGAVHGELVAGLDDRLFALLDRYEGVEEGLYARVEVEVLVGLRRRPAVTYVGVEPERRGGVLVPEGRWRRAVRRGRR